MENMRNVSWGYQIERHEPKIGCIPMMSVKKAEMKTMTSVTVIITVVGVPLSKHPVRRASHLYAHLTGKSRNKV